MQAGKWYIDGIDLWLNFSIVLEEGSADFLKLPATKPFVKHDWGDANGVDVDVSRIFLQERQGVLQLAILVNSENEFWQKRDAFLALLIQPGLRRLELASHGSRSYFVYYQETNSYTQVSALKGTGGAYTIAHRFSMTFVEPEPKLNPGNRYLVDEAGHFLIT